jgi:hypothetical protein
VSSTEHKNSVIICKNNSCSGNIRIKTMKFLIWGLRFSGLLCSIRWWFVTDAAGQHIGRIFKGWSFTAWHLKVGPVCCCEPSVTNYQPVPVNITDERRPQRHCGRSLKCFKFLILLVMWSLWCPSWRLYSHTSCATSSFFFIYTCK